jgi:hypothetical protein
MVVLPAPVVPTSAHVVPNGILKLLWMHKGQGERETERAMKKEQGGGEEEEEGTKVDGDADSFITSWHAGAS